MRLAAIALLLAPSLGLAQDGDALVRLRIDAEAALEAGRETWLAVSFEVEPGWHIYWKNPGDAGMATSLTLEVPPGWVAGEPRWPAPTRHEREGIVSYIFEERLTLLVPLRAPADAARGARVRLVAKGEWLVCDATGCLPGRGEAALELVVAPPGGETPARSPIFDETRRRLPGPAPADLRVTWSGTTLALALPGGALAFFPAAPDDVVPEQRARGDVVELVYPASIAGRAVTGVLLVRRGDTITHHEVAVTAPREEDE
jgi:DsbC/DsbD-like thiol-disulfide interchange protein